MNRLYIIEGQDRCGKSTAVNLLRKKIKNPRLFVIHSSKPPIGVDVREWTLAHYKHVVNYAIDLVMLGWDVIMDRSWLGETVYGPLYRNVNISLEELEDMFITNPMIDLETVKMLVLVDDASHIAMRSDGESMSDDLNMLEQERAAFKNSTLHTRIPNATLIDWEYEEFSVAALDEIVEVMINA